MEKQKKNLLIGGIVAIFAAFTMIFLSLVASGFNIERFQLKPRPEQREEIFDPRLLTEINLKTINEAVILKPSKDDQIHIEYQSSELETYELKEENGILTVAYKNLQSGWKQFINSFRYGILQFDFEDRKLTIYLPESYQQRISAKDTNGSITVDNLTLNHLDIHSTNGSIKVRNSNIDNLNLSSTNGSIRVEETKTEKTNVSSINGSIQFLNSYGEKLWFQSTNGSIKATIDGIQKEYNIKVSKVNGSCNVENQVSYTEQELNLSSINGSMKVTFQKS